MEFPLSRAPEMLFDRQLWEIFVSYFETSEIAYERIGFPPDLTGYHYEDYAARSSISKERWQEIEEACAVGRALLRGFRNKFEKEELTATGIPRGFWNPAREAIPSSLWLRLWPNFSGNWTMSTSESYDDVQVSWNVNSKTKNAELQDRLELYLLEQKRKGETLRKILILAAAEYFGQAIPIRVFNAGYSNVFKKPRGRSRQGNK
jgi:hypothetical protein